MYLTELVFGRVGVTAHVVGGAVLENRLIFLEELCFFFASFVRRKRFVFVTTLN